MVLKPIIGKDGSLLESIHAFSDFMVCKTVGVKVFRCEIVLSQNWSLKVWMAHSEALTLFSAGGTNW